MMQLTAGRSRYTHAWNPFARLGIPLPDSTRRSWSGRRRVAHRLAAISLSRRFCVMETSSCLDIVKVLFMDSALISEIDAPRRDSPSAKDTLSPV